MADYVRSVFEESTIGHAGSNMTQAASRIKVEALNVVESSLRSINTLKSFIENPFTLDGNALQRAKLTADDATAGDQFGCAVAIDGNTYVIGACLEDSSGSAYVFVRNGTTWSQQDKLIADDAATGDYFGGSVAISEDTCIVGASGDDSYTGSAYVFVRNGSTWTQQAKLVADDAAAGDCFGCAVAIEGNTCIVGTWNAPNQGCAYVFVRSGITWSQQAKLTADDLEVGDYFGISVGISANTCVVGVYSPSVGNAYIFVRNDSIWSEQDKLLTDPAVVGEYYFTSVAIDNNTCVIGIYGDDPGDAYVFTRSDSTWSRQAKFTSNDIASGDYFGISIAISGNTCIVGASGNDDGGADSGSAYVFARSGTTWRQQAKIIADDAVAGDQFGMGVAISGDTCISGAWLSSSETGSAYAFTAGIKPLATATHTRLPVISSNVTDSITKIANLVRLQSNIAVPEEYMLRAVTTLRSVAEKLLVFGGENYEQQAKLVAEEAAAYDRFGWNVAISGDTCIVGAIYDDYLTESNAGSACIFVRNGTTWSQQARLTASDAAAKDLFGQSVAIEGNTCVVGANSDDHEGGVNAGSAYVFVREGDVWTQQAKLVADDAAANDNFGINVTLYGNTCVVGARNDDHAGGADAGSAYVFVREGDVWTQQAKLIANDAVAGDLFGRCVSLYENTCIVGAHKADPNGESNAGSAYIFVRNGTNWSQQAKLVADTPSADDNFGLSVSVYGNTCIVGARYDDYVGNDAGCAYIFVRNGATWTKQGKLAANDAAANDYFGRSVAIYDNTCIIAAHADDHAGGVDAGSAYIFARNGTVWGQKAKLVANDGEAGDYFGRSVAIGGNSCAVGAYADTHAGGTAAGSAYVFNIGIKPLVANNYTKINLGESTINDTPIRPVGNYVKADATAITLLETSIKNVAYNKAPTLEIVTASDFHATPWQSVTAPNLYFRSVLAQQRSIALDAMDTATLGRFPSGTSVALLQGQGTIIPCFNYSAFSPNVKSRYANLVQSGLLEIYEDYFNFKRELPPWAAGDYVFGENNIISFVTVRTKVGDVDDIAPGVATLGKWVVPYGSVLLNLNFDGTLGSEAADAYIWSCFLLNGVRSSWNLLKACTNMDNGTEQLVENVNGRMLYVQLKNVTLGSGGTKVGIRLSGF